MAAHGARRLDRMNRNLNVIVGVELMCSAQGIEFRRPLQTSEKLMIAMGIIRDEVTTIENDRYLSDDIARAAAIVAEGRLLNQLGLSGFVVGEAA